MNKFSILAINVFLVLSFTGCGFVPVFPTVLLAGGGSGGIKIPLGPIRSEEFPKLLHDAIPDDEGMVRFYGKVEWSGFQNSISYLSSVTAITDTAILLLKWHETEKEYKIVTRLAYSEIQSVSAATWGGRAIYLYFDDKDILLGDQNYKIEGKATFIFVRPSGITADSEVNEATFLFLKSKIKLHESPSISSGDSSQDDF